MGCKLATKVLLITLSSAIGIYLFTDGLILKQEKGVKYFSVCDEWSPRKDGQNYPFFDKNLQRHLYKPPPNGTSDRCLSRKRSVGKVVIVLLDAVRHDFTVLYPDPNEHQRFYKNQLRVFEETAKKHPARAKLYRFVADSPTVTYQRIKALMTGAIPKFIEFRHNFNVERIVGLAGTDSILEQLKRRGLRSVMVGDVIWEVNFPGTFRRAFTKPALDIYDIDSDDANVDDHIYRELAEDDWDVLLAHYVGADHVGHSERANCPNMKRVLQRYEENVKRIIGAIDRMNDTVAFFMSDHGMLEDGNHGGSSQDEKNAFLFSYASPDLRFDRGEIGNEVDVLNQTNLSPTLSALFGVPFAFDNTGVFLRELFPIKNSQNSSSPMLREEELAVAYLENLLQLFRILQKSTAGTAELRRYKELENEFLTVQKEHFGLLVENERSAATPELAKKVAEKYDSIGRETRDVFLAIIDPFDQVLVAEGLIIGLLAFALSAFFALCPQDQEFEKRAKASILYSALTTLNPLNFLAIKAFGKNTSNSDLCPVLAGVYAISFLILVLPKITGKEIRALLARSKKNLAGPVPLVVLAAFILFSDIVFSVRLLEEELASCFKASMILGSVLFVPADVLSWKKNQSAYLNLFVCLGSIYGLLFFAFDKSSQQYDALLMSLVLNAFLWLGPRFFRRAVSPDTKSALLLRVGVPIFWISNWSWLSPAIPKTAIYFVNTITLLSACLNLLANYRSINGLYASTAAIFLCLNGPVSAPVFCCFTSIVSVLPKSKLFAGETNGKAAPEVELKMTGVFAFFLFANLFYHSNGTSYRISAIDYSCGFLILGLNFMTPALIFLRVYIPMILGALGLILAVEQMFESERKPFEKAVVCFQMLNVLKITLSMINLYYQKQHLLVDSNFMPKYIFDLFFAFVVNVVLSLLALK